MEYTAGRRFRLLDFNLIERKADNYLVKVTFQTAAGHNRHTPYSLVISLRLDGDDFEIVGHESPGSVERKGTGRKAAARPD